MTRAYLEGAGYRVLEAADGTEAIRLSVEHAGRIELVLTDILMPGMRGDSAVAEIRKVRPEIKAIYMSGYTDQIVGSDSDNIVYKPFEFPELGRCLRSILDPHPAAAPPRSDSSAA
jgi:CheY-like chemotaxis protein